MFKTLESAKAGDVTVRPILPKKKGTKKPRCRGGSSAEHQGVLKHHPFLDEASVQPIGARVQLGLFNVVPSVVLISLFDLCIRGIHC